MDFIRIVKEARISSINNSKLSYLAMIRLLSILGLTLFINGTIFAQSQVYGNEWIDYNKTYYKFPVRDQRFYRIPFNTLNNNGLAGTPVQQFQLWRDGKEVPIFTSSSSGTLDVTGYIEFFGTPNTGINERELYVNPLHHTNPDRSFFSDTAWYFLTVNAEGTNKRFSQAENLVGNTSLIPDSCYMHTVNPLAAATALNSGHSIVIEGQFLRSSRWDEGEGYCSSYFSVDRTTQFNVTGLRAFLNGPPMTLSYAVAGATAADRTAILRVNDNLFDSTHIPFFRLSRKTFQNLDPTGYLLNDGINFKFNSNNPVWFENVTVNALSLTYPRQFFHNSQNPLKINLLANNNGNHIRLAGLPNGATIPVLYDLTNLKRYTGITKQDSSLFLLAPSPFQREIVIGTQVASHLRSITTLQQVSFKNYTLSSNQGNYLIISNKRLRTGSEDVVGAYGAYRSSSGGGGYDVLISDIDELGDQFCYGNRKNPLTIKRFILFAIDKFATKPKMVFLIGRGSNYYSAYRSGGGWAAEILNSVPTWGVPGSDNLLAARNDMKPVPEIPIGRLSAINPEEIKVYLEKVKQFEALQKVKPLLPSANDWRKDILHLVGGEDPFLADSILWRHLEAYGNIIKQPLPGASVNQFKRPNNPTFAKDIKFIEERISEGVGLITYFGHSSVSSIDFNLGSPDLYKNKDGKYPVFIANGCRAGNIFEFSGQRLSAKESTISDNFIFAPNKGAISFLSNSDLAAINYQNLLTREWYTAFSGSKFGKTIGEIQKEALNNAFNRTGTFDRLNLYNIEQNVLHSDPAIVPFLPTLPDFAVEVSSIKTEPAKLIAELDSIDIQITYYNLGTAVNDSVLITLEREMPDGTSRLIYKGRHSHIYNRDSLTVRLGLKGLFEEGSGYLVARIDPANDWQENDKDNNVAVTPFNMSRNHITPVFPYNYSIVNHPDIKLKAATTNPLETALMYTFQMDTTALFNSPLLEVKDTIVAGGIIEWKPLQPIIESTVYYWRTLQNNDLISPETPIFSFMYLPGTNVGFNQSHYYQHKKSTGIQFELNKEGNWVYGQKEHNIYVSHGIYSSSGNEDSHFSITVNGEMNIKSACIGRSIIFNLFDSLNFQQIANSPTGDYGSAAVCGPGREFNFEFNYYSQSNRKKIMDFIESIPKGTYVAARLVVDPPYDSLQSKYWKADTSVFGKDKSLYHSLYNQGFYLLDSLNRTKTFFFMFRKDDSVSFKPVSVLSRGTIDRVYYTGYPTVTDREGSLTSPWMGPSKSWKQANWKFNKLSGDVPDWETFKLELWGKTTKGKITKLKDWTSLEDNFNIGDIDANEYPFLQYRINSGGAYGTPPPQLQYWRLFYDPLPDGAWSGNDLFYLKKNTLTPFSDTLSMKLAFKNVSVAMLDSTDINVYIAEINAPPSLFYSTKFKSLQPNDTAILNIEKVFSMAEGSYQLLIEANENGKPKEQHYFNNRALIPVAVSGSPLSADQFLFEAEKVGRKVALKWETPENPFIVSYGIEHSTTGQFFNTIAEKVKHSGRRNELLQFSSMHDQPANGYNYYRVVLMQKDGTIKYSEIRKVYFEAENYVKVAPNPFNHYFILQPMDNDIEWQVRILDISGKLIGAEKGSGGTRINMGNASDGIYFLHWTSGDKTQIIKILKK